MITKNANFWAPIPEILIQFVGVESRNHPGDSDSGSRVFTFNKGSYKGTETSQAFIRQITTVWLDLEETMLSIP